jgi:DNA-binding MarR family transcriptional regulator
MPKLAIKPSTGGPDGPAEVSQEAFEALAAFRLELRRYLSFAQSAAKMHGVTMEQHQAMLAIRASPARSLSVGELAKDLFLRHHSTVELVDRLARLGMVARCKDPRDGRKVNVVLTERGEATLAGLAASHLSELGDQAPDLARALRKIALSAAAR